MQIETELKTVRANSYLELKHLHPTSFCRRLVRGGYEGVIEVKKQIQYTIKCYQGCQHLWTVTKTELSSVAQFVLNSEQYRKPNLQGAYSIVINQEYVNFPGEHKTLENFCTNDCTLVKQLAMCP